VAISLLSLIFLPLSQTGCNGGEQEENEQPLVAVAIVMGNHGNAFGLNLSSPNLIATVSDAASNGFVSVTCCDGQPHIVSADKYVIPPQYRQADPAKLKADAQQKAANILAGLVHIKAKNPELDTLAALAQAVRSFAAAPDGSQKIIYVLDSGLSTTGQLDFRKNLLDAEPGAIADLLAERDAVPDFTGITVKWQQLGDASAPQKPLSYAQAQKLGAIWTAIVEKGGGRMEISNVPSSQTANDASQYPPVSIVDLPLEDPISFETPEPFPTPTTTPEPAVTLEQAETFDPTETTVFREQLVRFIGGSAEYVDPVKAEAVLRPAADYMTRHPEFKGLLIGTTATGRKGFCLKLSQERAKAVYDTLVSMGVQSGQLITLGLGFDDPWHIADTDSKGYLTEHLASQNRKVVLMAADSPEALAILDG